MYRGFNILPDLLLKHPEAVGVLRVSLKHVVAAEHAGHLKAVVAYAEPYMVEARRPAYCHVLRRIPQAYHDSPAYRLPRELRHRVLHLVAAEPRPHPRPVCVFVPVDAARQVARYARDIFLHMLPVSRHVIRYEKIVRILVLYY